MCCIEAITVEDKPAKAAERDPKLAYLLTNENKIYVETIPLGIRTGCLFRTGSFTWTVQYEIEKLLDVRPATSLKAGGCGILYTVRVMGKKTFLFHKYDMGIVMWFMKRKGAIGLPINIH